MIDFPKECVICSVIHGVEAYRKTIAIFASEYSYTINGYFIMWILKDRASSMEKEVCSHLPRAADLIGASLMGVM